MTTNTQQDFLQSEIHVQCLTPTTNALHAHLSVSLGKDIECGHTLSLGTLEENAGSFLHNGLRDVFHQLNYGSPDTTPLGQPHTLSLLYINATAKTVLYGEGGEGMNFLQEVKTVQGSDEKAWALASGETGFKTRLIPTASQPCFRKHGNDNTYRLILSFIKL